MFKHLLLFLVACVVGHAAVAAVPASQSAVSTKAKPKKPAAVKALPATPVPLVELSADQMAVASRVTLGEVPCEIGAKVTVRADANPGRFWISLGRQSFRMEPAITTTGAIRLEDPESGTVWLQLGNKSMLLNQRLGKRLADACVNAEQTAIASAMERNNAPGLLDDAASPSGR